MNDQSTTVYWRLIQQHQGLAPARLEEKWRLLAAAHVVGQPRFTLHLHSHLTMLVLALRTRDWAEARGQLLRLLLVPIGHALSRLPAGNTGRANVSAFRPMAVSAELRALIEGAQRR
jgi:hypothetical protein